MKQLINYLLLLPLALVLATACDDDERRYVKPEKPVLEKFTWDGDWNDSTHVKYTDGNFNPIIGVWEAMAANSTVRFEYTVDFMRYTSHWNEKTQTYILYGIYKYKINDNAYQFSILQSNGEFGEYKNYQGYKIEGDILYMDQRTQGIGSTIPLQENWPKYKRIR